MSRFHVVGIMRYTDALQSNLDNYLRLEMNRILTRQTGYTRQENIEMYGSGFPDRRLHNELDSKHGEHSHYFLFNDNAVQVFRDHQIPLDIIDEIELDDPMNDGFALLIKTTRFI